jgi:hypothetical protein
MNDSLCNFQPKVLRQSGVRKDRFCSFQNRVIAVVDDAILLLEIERAYLGNNPLYVEVFFQLLLKFAPSITSEPFDLAYCLLCNQI